jgi:hypothetical protein
MKVSWYPTAEMIKWKNKGSRFGGYNVISIHALIPDDKKIDPSFVAHNLIVSIKRKREESLKQYLYRRMQDPQTLISPKRVSGYCKKWLVRILANSLRNGIRNGVSAETMADYEVALSILEMERYDRKRYHKKVAESQS